MKKAHKHAELIKAWADGADVQWYSIVDNRWRDVCLPLWDEQVIYRIKHEPPQDIILNNLVRFNKRNFSPVPIVLITWTGDSDPIIPDDVKYDNHLQYIFDGDTLKLKEIVIK